ncbi:hypothetical protein [Adhaeribacter soli]|uniref:Uncharacterized protein n=1 Tax=Adhaeribacter soli TaxID=2607655 RepID=A0A5N1J2J6_9BACT|nr:hypothetical protein [Adhaeribacter soli]KAA9338852.1 hypothetical protein F0P94_08645 [Adhaeribacter soli]
MLIYLKFWEGDLFIKKLYQFTRLLLGEHYDWYFKISDSPKDKNTSTGKRHEIIREKVRDLLKGISPIIYNLLKDSYIPQLRNSIAHSNYSFLGRAIHLNNDDKNSKFPQLTGISFDSWIDIFHKTLVLHHQLLKMDYMINDYYSKIYLMDNSPLPILITEKNGMQYELPIEYDKDFNRWHYLQIAD